MKLSVAVAALLAALPLLAAGETCQVGTFSSLVKDPNINKCVTKSGVVFADLTAAPTEAQMQAMCDTDSCVALLEAVLAKDPADCTLPIGSGLSLRSDLIDPIIEYCTANGVAITASTNSSGSTGGSGSSPSGAGGVDVGSDDTRAADTPAPSPTDNGAAGISLATASATFAVAVVVSVML